MKRLSLAILLLSASYAQAAPLDISGAWFRALPGKLPAGGYFTAQNNSRRDIAITGARSEACGMLMIHQSSNKGGMSGMDMMETVKVPAGGQVSFAPGGYHLMCEGAKMKIGTRIPVLINLSDGTSVAVAFDVRGATGK
ncbi:MAG: copper chaperone PCu(A)C [Alphaproteobacteria bacterium]|nr:copper chaperone PCu(A)C [Alphaproteobacteria bacterium]